MQAPQKYYVQVWFTPDHFGYHGLTGTVIHNFNEKELMNLQRAKDMCAKYRDDGRGAYVHKA